jgi:hypothetical protein
MNLDLLARGRHVKGQIQLGDDGSIENGGWKKGARSAANATEIVDHVFGMPVSLDGLGTDGMQLRFRAANLRYGRVGAERRVQSVFIHGIVADTWFQPRDT